LCCECCIAFYCTQSDNRDVRERLKILATQRSVLPQEGRPNTRKTTSITASNLY
jgi:hypothetical protein